MNNSPDADSGRVPWNKGKLIGQKLPLKQREFGASVPPTLNTSTIFESSPCSIGHRQQVARM